MELLSRKIKEQFYQELIRVTNLENLITRDILDFRPFLSSGLFKAHSVFTSEWAFFVIALAGEIIRALQLRLL